MCHVVPLLCQSLNSCQPLGCRWTCRRHVEDDTFSRGYCGACWQQWSEAGLLFASSRPSPAALVPSVEHHASRDLYETSTFGAVILGYRLPQVLSNGTIVRWARRIPACARSMHLATTSLALPPVVSWACVLICSCHHYHQ